MRYLTNLMLFRASTIYDLFYGQRVKMNLYNQTVMLEQKAEK